MRVARTVDVEELAVPDEGIAVGPGAVAAVLVGVVPGHAARRIVGPGLLVGYARVLDALRRSPSLVVYLRRAVRVARHRAVTGQGDRHAVAVDGPALDVIGRVGVCGPDGVQDERRIGRHGVGGARGHETRAAREQVGAVVGKTAGGISGRD